MAAYEHIAVTPMRAPEPVVTPEVKEYINLTKQPTRRIFITTWAYRKLRRWLRKRWRRARPMVGHGARAVFAGLQAMPGFGKLLLLLMAAVLILWLALAA